MCGARLCSLTFLSAYQASLEASAFSSWTGEGWEWWVQGADEAGAPALAYGITSKLIFVRITICLLK